MRLFITFEGIEGSGKTTQIQMLSNALEERSIEHLLTREPGGTPIGDQIRRLVLHPGNNAMTPTCELLLYVAARAQHVEQVIRPGLDEGRLVLCDRFKDATLAYQGHGRGLPLELIRRLHQLEVLAIDPDLTILLDLDAETAVERARRRDDDGETEEARFEMEALEFHDRVRNGYLDLARRDPRRIVVVDARGAAAEVHRRILAAVERFL